MGRSNFTKIAAIGLLAIVTACASAPSRIDNVCAVFDQRDGWIDNWRSAAEAAEAKYGVPVPILMATIRKELAFKRNAKPPRTKLLGFIPWTRVSSAHGYSQALDGTWSQYQRETGNFMARRTKFADAVDFVGWYHAKSSKSLGIARNDTFRLYLAYYSGWTAYQRGDWQRDAGIQRYARETDRMARNYAAQLNSCR